MSINNVEIQDSNGNVYYPHTDASVVKYGNSNVDTALSEKANQTDLNTTNSNVSTNTTNIAQLSNPNLLINGDFQVWQRGTSFTNGYGVDRWIANSDTGVTVNKTTNGVNVKANTTGTWTNFSQYVEGDQIRKLIGKKMTLTFKISSSTNNVAQVWVKDKETSNYYAAINFTSITSDTFSVTFTLGAITNNIECGIQVKSNAGASIEIMWVKLEVGSMLTPFSPRLYSEELALCQRYYENNFVVGGHGIVDPNGNVALFIPYKVTKRVSPTVTVNSSLLSNCLSQVGYTPKTPKSITLSDRDINGELVFFGGLTDAVGYNITIADNSALKNLITADAEIY